MDRSRFGGVVKGGGAVRFIGSAAEADGADLVVVDLDRCDDVAAFGSLATRTIGFGSHVDERGLAAATAAGFDEVLARSVFFRRLSDLLAGGGNDEGLGRNLPPAG